MSRYVLDTGIVLGLLRGAPYANKVLEEYQPFTAPQVTIQSIVTLAELEAMGYRLQWGKTKLETLDTLLRTIPRQDLNHPAIIRKYVEIDAYRHNGHPEKKLPKGASAFAMGDNDIWIAATAAAFQATLLTTDKDFLPLHGIFLDVTWVDPKGSGFNNFLNSMPPQKSTLENVANSCGNPHPSSPTVRMEESRTVVKGYLKTRFVRRVYP